MLKSENTAHRSLLIAHCSLLIPKSEIRNPKSSVGAKSKFGENRGWRLAANFGSSMTAALCGTKSPLPLPGIALCEVSAIDGTGNCCTETSVKRQLDCCQKCGQRGDESSCRVTMGT